MIINYCININYYHKTLPKCKIKNIIKQKWIRMIFTEKIRDYVTGEFKVQKVQDLFVTYTIIQRVYNQQWNVSQVHSMDSAIL